MQVFVSAHWTMFPSSPIARLRPLWLILLLSLCKFTWVWNAGGDTRSAVMDISSFIEDLWHRRMKTVTQKDPRERKRKRAAAKLCRVLKIVKQFQRPATLESIKIDLFVMRGDPFGSPRAWNLCETGVSIRKTGRQRLKDDGGGGEWKSQRAGLFSFFKKRENRPLI